jgi:hypothetical protein
VAGEPRFPAFIKTKIIKKYVVKYKYGKKKVKRSLFTKYSRKI